jgi:MFS family permease
MEGAILSQARVGARLHRFRAAARAANGGTFLFNASNALFLLFPVYLQQMRASPTQIGLVAGLIRAGSLIARPLGGQFLDRFGRRKILGAGALCMLVGILSLFVLPRMGPAFFGFRLLQGAGTSLLGRSRNGGRL